MTSSALCSSHQCFEIFATITEVFPVEMSQAGRASSDIEPLDQEKTVFVQAQKSTKGRLCEILQVRFDVHSKNWPVLFLL